MIESPPNHINTRIRDHLLVDREGMWAAMERHPRALAITARLSIDGKRTGLRRVGPPAG